MTNALLTVSKAELLDDEGDRAFRGLLYDYFAFGRSLEACREIFAGFIDLTATQYLILIAIKNSAKGPMGVNQIAERLYLTGAFVTNEIKKLVDDGLLTKTRHPVDGRRVQLALTAEGMNVLKRLAALQRPVNDALFGMLTRDEFRMLSAILSRLASHSDHALKVAEVVRATLTEERSKRIAAPAPAQKRQRTRATDAKAKSRART